MPAPQAPRLYPGLGWGCFVVYSLQRRELWEVESPFVISVHLQVSSWGRLMNLEEPREMLLGERGLSRAAPLLPIFLLS